MTPEQASSRAFQFGIALNMAYVVAELVSGFLTHSLALITDAGHNFTDVIGLALSLLALRLMRAKSNARFTYGYKKTTILAALVNAAVLLIAIGMLGYESVVRLYHPEPVQGGTVALIAAIGIAVNFISAFLFYKSRKNELNAKAAYLHLLADGLVSVGVVIAGLVIKYTGLYWLDPVVSLVILLVILFSTWNLLRESLELSLDAVPREVSLREVEGLIRKVDGVRGVHHIHVWAMSTMENALTAHLVVDAGIETGQLQQLVRKVKHLLLHHHIQHATLEVEAGGHCSDEQH